MPGWRSVCVIYLDICTFADHTSYRSLDVASGDTSWTYGRVCCIVYMFDEEDIEIIDKKNFIMAYNEKLAERIRESFAGVRNTEEKKMFGGIAFMINDKMCVGVNNEDLILRCEPEMTEKLLSKKGVRLFDLTGRPMKGWLLISPESTSNKKDFDFWINLALESNKKISSPKLATKSKK